MIRPQLTADLKSVLANLSWSVDQLELALTENPQFGEYATNIAMRLAVEVGQPPRQVAQQIVDQLGQRDYLAKVEIAGPGFINFYLTEAALLANLDQEMVNTKPKTQNYLVEYAQPNTHKAFHIGHLRNITIGESLSRLIEVGGAEVTRVTYGGDIGPHVAKAIWGILQKNDEYQAKKSSSVSEKAEFIGQAYVFANDQYEASTEVKLEIDQINKKLYAHDPALQEIWLETRQWCIDAFNTLYQRLETKFDAEIWESEVEVEGKTTVLKHLGQVFKQDQGAIIFPGEDYGLHNRVFITSQGYPTYEAKEVGLTLTEYRRYSFDKSLHVIDVSQSDFFKVVTKAIELIEPSLEGKKQMLGYGLVALAGGQKMSSRKGNVITGEGLIQEVKQQLAANLAATKADLDDELIDQIVLGAIKFNFLKYSSNSQINFDIQKSLDIHGDSGPYVQYTHARIQSLLDKAANSVRGETPNSAEISDIERNLLRQIEYFDSIAEKAIAELEPNVIANYLLELAKNYNLFYQSSPIIGSDQQLFKLRLSSQVGRVIKQGLWLLGIAAPNRM